MPFLLPVHQVSSDGKFLAIDLLARFGNIEILAKELHRIHVQLGSEVIQRTHGKDRSLRMIRRTPRSPRSDVVANGGVLLALVGNGKDVRNGRHSTAAGAAGAPGIRLPRDKHAVFFRAYFNASICRRACAGGFELRIALEHDANRLASGLLRYLCSKDPPAIWRKLAAETSAHVILVDMDVGGGNFQGLGHLPGNTRDVLSGNVGEQVILIGPLGNGSVTFQAAMRYDRNAVKTLRNNFGVCESLVGISQSLSSSFLIVGFSLAGSFRMEGCGAQRIQHGIARAL